MTPAGKLYMKIQAVGIGVLPSLVAQMQAGHYEFADMAYNLVNHKAPETDALFPNDSDRAKALIAWWEQNKQDWLIPWPDTPPPPEPAPKE